MGKVVHCRGGGSAVEAICRESIVASDSTPVVADPRIVTCKACLRALHSRVQFYNWLLTEAKAADAPPARRAAAK